MEARWYPQGRKRAVWFSPLLFAVALSPAFLQITCERPGNTRLASLEFEVLDVNRITFDPMLRVYDLWFPAGATTATVRAVSMDPLAKVTWYVPGGDATLAGGPIGVGGGEVTVDLPPDGYALYIGVFPPEGARDTYILSINPECPVGALCDDGNECTANQCNPPNYASCIHPALPDGMLCGTDGVCDADACWERSWGIAVLLETNDADAGSPQLKMSTQGDAVAVWWQAMLPGPLSGNYPIRSNRFTSGAWGVPEMIGIGLSVHTLVGNPSGDAAAVWPTYAGQLGRSFGAGRLVSGFWANSWAPPSGDGFNLHYSPQIAMDAQSNLLVVWVQSRSTPMGTGFALRAARLTSDVWSYHELDPGPPGSAIGHQLFMDPDGNALVLWSRESDRLIARMTSGTWGVAESLGDSGGISQVVKDWEGSTVAVWWESGGVWTNLVTPGAWDVPDPLFDVGVSAQLITDSQGNAVAVWEQSDGVGSNIWANQFAPSGGWGTAERIDNDATGTAASPQLSLNPQGDAVVVWQQSDGVRESIWAIRLTSGVWGTAQRIELDDVGDAMAPQVGMDAQGNAIAVWQQWDGVRNNIWANRYE